VTLGNAQKVEREKSPNIRRADHLGEKAVGLGEETLAETN